MSGLGALPLLFASTGSTIALVVFGLLVVLVAARLMRSIQRTSQSVEDQFRRPDRDEDDLL